MLTRMFPSCFCRTEWCYKCGKALRGTQDVCPCYPPRPPLVPPPVQPAQEEVQAQSEVIIIHDEGGHDNKMIDVKPSIEEIERTAVQMFNAGPDLIADLRRHANLADQNGTHDLIVQPGVSGPEDVMRELDALAVPNARPTRDLVQRETDLSDTYEPWGSSSFVREYTTGSQLDSLEDMLDAFDSYNAAQSSCSRMLVPIIDLDKTETDPISGMDFADGNYPGQIEAQSIRLPPRLTSEDVTDSRAPKPPRYAHTPPLGFDLGTGIHSTSRHEDARLTISEELSTTTSSGPNATLMLPKPLTSIVPQPESIVSPHSPSTQFDETQDVSSQTISAKHEIVAELNGDWFMDSIEGFLGL